jgi:hypothetical protein
MYLYSRYKIMFERNPCVQAYGLTAKKEGLLNANQLIIS